MCDTMVALGNSTKDGAVLFAKNSDRQPNEPHIMVHVPRRKYNESNEPLKATYINIPQVAETYEVLLLKPSWIWGCEMGCNEFGLNIGNEAVFTKEKCGSVGLTGMDLVRIALERCRTSTEALKLITRLLAAHGQGGNCGYEKPFFYHNSFLIADQNSAWVLETAGQYWAAKKVNDIYAISNCLTLEADFDESHPELIKHAVDQKWCRSERDFNFRKCYSQHFITKVSGAYLRYQTCRSHLEQEKGSITIDTMKRILRSHEPKNEGRQFNHSSAKGVCMHGGGFVDVHTTGSYIASLTEKNHTYWVTGASTPCISVYKPVWLVKDTQLFSEQQQLAAVQYWKLRERLHRMVMAGAVDLNWYLQERNRLEADFNQVWEQIDFRNVTEEKLAAKSNEAFAAEAQLIEKAILQAERSSQRRKLSGNWFFNSYWDKKNKGLKVNI